MWNRFSARFTPAHAGNTESVPAMFLQAQVHPRSRGEYILEGKYFCSRIGSPPLTRGIHCYGDAVTYAGGFTPAHAGNTLFCAYRTWYMEVHPRSRGEYLMWWQLLSLMQGSPPLTRGIH